MDKDNPKEKRQQLTQTEVQLRVDDIYRMRFNPQDGKKPMRQFEWIAYCHEHYGDKSEKQYCAYWATAKNQYDERWKEQMGNLLEPASRKLRELLAHENPQIAQRALDQIVRYTGNDVHKIEAEVNERITIQWGDPTIEEKDINREDG